jgi:peptidoglycan/xylan/chitin deacetylase (PgdA/CDA1 family)
MQIASHGFNHRDSVVIGPKNTSNEITSLDNLMKSFLGKKPAYFRPPYGSYNASTVTVAEKAGHRYIVLWNADTLDWQSRNVNATFQAIKAIMNGGWSEGLISLLHDPIPSSISYNLLSQIVKYGKSKGFKFVTVAECAGDAKGGYQ